MVPKSPVTGGQRQKNSRLWPATQRWRPAGLHEIHLKPNPNKAKPVEAEECVLCKHKERTLTPSIPVPSQLCAGICTQALGMGWGADQGGSRSSPASLDEHERWEWGGERTKEGSGAQRPAQMNDELQVQGETKVESHRGAHLLPTSGLYPSPGIYTPAPTPAPPKDRKKSVKAIILLTRQIMLQKNNNKKSEVFNCN